MVISASIDYSKMRVLDLTRLESRRIRVRGTFAYIPDTKRERYADTEYLLVREPDNRYDPYAVAIYSDQRKIGYVAAATAGRLSPLLDELRGFDGYVVPGAAEVIPGMTVRYFVSVPTIPALRKYISSHT
jgi:hypothetical protein